MEMAIKKSKWIFLIMKRLFDLFFGSIFLIILAVPMLIISILIRLTSKDSSLYWSDRVGKNSIIFKMPKFRSMKAETPDVPTHLLRNPDSYLSPIGSFLRHSSLDELPQLFSVIKGDMSLVGPRPVLYNQVDLIEIRKEKGIDKLLPGITGWAQVNGRDEILIFDKVALEVEYLNRQTFWFDLKILLMTLLKVIKRDGVSH